MYNNNCDGNTLITIKKEEGIFMNHSLTKIRKGLSFLVFISSTLFFVRSGEVIHLLFLIASILIKGQSSSEL